MKQDYNSLLNTVKHHSKLYYDDNAPILSDYEYDQLYDRLSSIEIRQGWADSSSPTVRVGNSKGKIKHPFPLYSLKKVYEQDEIDPEFTVETVKIDGTNLSVTYDEKGNLLHALTRGDGEFGENVTHLVNYIASIPLTITPQDKILTVIGEVVTDKENVQNFRNFVSGSLGIKNAEEIIDRSLRFIVHDVAGIEEDYSVRVKSLHSFGFVSTFNWDCSSYPSDGIVYRVESYKREKLLGTTSKYPRYAVALKTRGAMTAVTTIQDIFWSIGRTGVVTPVAVVDPVNIDDATISRVILHNIDFIEQHELGLGDEILIERQITPQFVKVLSKSKFARFCVADAEKKLGLKLHREGPKLFTSDKDGNKSVEYFVKQLGIKGLGPAWIQKLDLTHPNDLFKEEVPWEHMGKNGEKVLEELSRPKEYYSVLGALGIPGVGKNTAKRIIQKIPSFDRLREIEYENISGIGPKTVDSILAWLDVNESWVKTLPYSLTASTFVEEATNNLTVAVSGKLDMTKQDLSDHLQDLNIVLKDRVTKDIDYLISSGEETSKVAKARQYNIPIINYWQNKKYILRGELTHGGSY